MTLRDELYAIENRLWTEGGDAYREHRDEECLWVFAEMATETTRDEVVASVEEPRWERVEMEPVGLLRPLDDVTVVT